MSFGCDHAGFPYKDSIKQMLEEAGIEVVGFGTNSECWNLEIVELARQHNDANVLSLPVRFLSEAQAVQYVQAFLSTAFEGGRHQRRIDKIACR